MKHLKATSITLAVSFFISGLAHANQANEEKKLQEQASEFKVDKEGITTLSSDKMIKEIILSSQARDAFREDELMSNLATGTKLSELQLLETSKKYKIESFILENVPAHILASGEKVINAYIIENFIDKKNNIASKDQIKTVWESTSDAISVPIVVSDTWSPTTTASTVADSKTVNTEDEPTIDKKNKDGLSKDELAALAELGMSEDDLKQMLSGDTTGPKEPEVKNKAQDSNKHSSPDTDGHIVLDKLSVERVVIMGKSLFADLKITFKQIKNGMQRTINRSFQSMEPGDIFQIENNQFELVSLNDKQIVIENLNTKRTSREIID